MNELFATPELISAFKAGLLGLVVGGIFGIIGIFLGWILVNYFIN